MYSVEYFGNAGIVFRKPFPTLEEAKAFVDRARITGGIFYIIEGSKAVEMVRK